MANICSYAFTPLKGETAPTFTDPAGYDQEINHRGQLTGSRKWAPPLEILQALEATGRLEWEECGCAGLGYYDLVNGEVVAELVIDAPNNLKEALEALEAHPELNDGLEPFIDQYSDEDGQ